MNEVAERVLSGWCEEQIRGLSPRIRHLVCAANLDLIYGPYSCDDYPGFTAACKEIASAIEGIIQDIWIDVNAEVVETSEPKGFHDGDEWIEPCWEDYVFLEARHVKFCLLGQELAHHI